MKSTCKNSNWFKSNSGFSEYANFSKVKKKLDVTINIYLSQSAFVMSLGEHKFKQKVYIKLALIYMQLYHIFFYI